MPFDASIFCRYFHRSFGYCIFYFKFLSRFQKEFPVTIGWKVLSFSTLWNTRMANENSDDIYSMFRDNLEQKMLDNIIKIILLMINQDCSNEQGIYYSASSFDRMQSYRDSRFSTTEGKDSIEILQPKMSTVIFRTLGWSLGIHVKWYWCNCRHRSGEILLKMFQYSDPTSGNRSRW